MMQRQPLPVECEQLTDHLKRHLFADKGPDALALADSTTLHLWNMVCAAAERVAPLFAEVRDERGLTPSVEPSAEVQK